MILFFQMGCDDIESNDSELVSNIQNEFLLVGCFYKNPDLYITYGKFIKSKYDFYDEASKFFYDCFELMYKSFSQEMNELNINTFMSQDQERFKIYRKFKGYTIIKTWADMSNIDDVENYFNIVKKYSLVREYSRKGFPVKKIVDMKNFNLMKAEDVHKFIKGTADKINTIILCNNESVVINANVQETTENYLLEPQMGISIPWAMINEMFRGCRLGKTVFDGMLSNEGKTRKLMLLAAYTTLINKKDFLVMSNEMDEEDLKSCMFVTVLNNPCFQEIHGIKIKKPEREYVLGKYRDDETNQFITRLKDGDGNFIESADEYVNRVFKQSTEYRKIQELSKWLDENTYSNSKLRFKDVGKDYSDQTLEFEIKKHHELYGIKYYGYDTLKGFRTDDWQTVKQTATFLKETTKSEKTFLYAVFQLTDESVYTQINQLSSNNIANAKQIKHVVDHLILGKRIDKADYSKYKYLPLNDWGTPTPEELKSNVVYYGNKIDKNRGGSKDAMPIFEVDLDYNIWTNVGELVVK